MISEALIQEIVERLRAGKRVRRTLPLNGRLHIDRPLPFLVVHRRPACEDPGTYRLVLGESSYLLATHAKDQQPSLNILVREVSKTVADEYGAFLLIEVWTADDAPTFKILTPKQDSVPSTVKALQKALAAIDLSLGNTTVEVSAGPSSPPEMGALLTTEEAKKLGCLMIGIQVQSCFRDASGHVYPEALRHLHRKFSQALRKAQFDFVSVQTKLRPKHEHALGRKSAVKAVWEADREMAAISKAYNFLLAVTPVNSEEAFAEFIADGEKNEPSFHYRLLPFDPAELKRRLFEIDLEKVEDPTLAIILRQKRHELDRQLTMLDERGEPNFLFGSQALFGTIDDDFASLAVNLLGSLPAAESEPPTVTASEFARRARAEIAEYAEQHGDMPAEVQIRDDVPGVMVASGDLLIPQNLAVSESRAEALLQHEVGTHVVTYWNGRKQPLRLLYCGFPGYEELQEGLAVLAEFLVGGLNAARMRTLAARVVAAHAMLQGQTFPDVYASLKQIGFSPRHSFGIAMRVFRGGGLTKDAVYLRGLAKLLDYLAAEGELEPILVGKISLEDVPLIEELLWRETLSKPKLTPRYLQTPEARERLKQVREGISVLDLVKGSA